MQRYLGWQDGDVKYTYIGMIKIKQIFYSFNLFLEWNLRFYKYNAFLFYTPFLSSQGSPHLSMGCMGCCLRLDPLRLSAWIFWMARWGCKKTYIVMMNIKQINYSFNLFLENISQIKCIPISHPYLAISKIPIFWIGCMGCNATLDPLWLNAGISGMARLGWKKIHS